MSLGFAFPSDGHRVRTARPRRRLQTGYVPLHSGLACHLLDWHSQTPYSEETDFVFPSLRANGMVPVSPAIFVADHLRTAAIGIGIAIEKGQRFGLHNLRHSLSNWLINKAKTEPKTVQGILRHSRIQTTMDLYTQEDADENTGGARAVSEGPWHAVAGHSVAVG